MPWVARSTLQADAWRSLALTCCLSAGRAGCVSHGVHHTCDVDGLASKVALLNNAATFTRQGTGQYSTKCGTIPTCRTLCTNLNPADVIAN